jgi:4-hydroxyphenylpyruvate dioxygenase-like putative hemolysin
MCGAFYDAVSAAALSHRADRRLDDALAAARKHQVLDAWQWERTRVDVDAAPLVAATGALALFTRHRDDASIYDAALSVY